LNTFLAAATAAFLFLAPFAGSAGLRATALILAAFALAALRSTAVTPYLARIPRGIAAAFAAWGLLAGASLAWSADPAYTLGELRAELFYGTLALGVFFLAAQSPDRWRLWWSALIAGTLAVFALHGLQQALDVALTRHPVFEQRGPWSTHLVLVAPLVLALGWPAPWGRAASPALQAAALGLLLFATWETDNRIVWVALTAQLALAFGLRGRTEAADARAGAARALVGAAALATLLAFGAAILERNALHFAGAGAVTESLERDVRPRIWAVAWKKFGEAPWLGHGFGREILASDFVPQTPAVLNHPPIRHGHNVFIDIALQLGVAGLAVFLALVALLAREYRAYLARPGIAPLGVIGLMVLAGFLVKCLTDDFLHRHNGLVFWALNGMLLGLGRASGAAAPTRRAGAAPP
jgi:O-antigen ligase